VLPRGFNRNHGLIKGEKGRREGAGPEKEDTSLPYAGLPMR